MTNTVLVIDDEQVLAGAMRDYLGRHGYAVNVKSSGEEALKVIDREPPDIVVLDYRLPRMDGLDAPQRPLLSAQGSGDPLTAVARTGR